MLFRSQMKVEEFAKILWDANRETNRHIMGATGWGEWESADETQRIWYLAYARRIMKMTRTKC